MWRDGSRDHRQSKRAPPRIVFLFCSCWHRQTRGAPAHGPHSSAKKERGACVAFLFLTSKSPYKGGILGSCAISFGPLRFFAEQRLYIRVHFCYGPATRPPREICRWASESWFPATLPSKLRVPDYFPIGLPPIEHSSLCWMHSHGRDRRSEPVTLVGAATIYICKRAQSKPSNIPTGTDVTAFVPKAISTVYGLTSQCSKMLRQRQPKIKRVPRPAPRPISAMRPRGDGMVLRAPHTLRIS